MPFFDGHNDVLLRLWQKNSAAAVFDFIDGEKGGHIDLPRAHDGEFIGGLFALYAPSHDPPQLNSLNPAASFPVHFAAAKRAVDGEFAVFQKLVREVPNQGFVQCLNVADIHNAAKRGAIAAVLHMEGAEAIAPDLSNLQHYYDLGLRSLGPVWSRPNVFGHGVPFRWPSSPDTGPGLTAEGKALVKACNASSIMVDVSHLNAKGFWEVAEISTAPLVATHSNAHVLSPSSRNLTDDQIKAIGESGGMIGLNFAVDFLQDVGVLTTAIAPEVLIRHLDHMMALAGEDCVGLGSDFDGADVPQFISDVSGLPNLVPAMEKAGYGQALIAKLCHENWMRVLAKTWHS